MTTFILSLLFIISCTQRQQTSKRFDAVFTKLVADLDEQFGQYSVPYDVRERLKDCFFQNTVGGKCNRGTSVINTCLILHGDERLPKEQYFLAVALGWMVELLQAYLLVVDDIMDGSHTRRGRPCCAANDGCLLSSCIFILLKRYFQGHRNYIEKQSFTATYKTAYYSFYLPVALALLFCDKATEKNLRAAKDILIPIGEYFQIQDDYLDNFADPSVLGKVGTDIQENKCSWLVQRKLLEESYGRPGREQEAKRLYDELELEKIYHNFEQRRVQEIEEIISKLGESNRLKREIFTTFLEKIHRRRR
ncbi:farnesyl pyrophosphate synthetase [Macrophomina phaseolina]|uniref:Farnesyl pyrophosphate synthetase n=1 Tax=Macrophomina phaseolina TaxID=35725 RepID=A0ABQ8G535_9PEZI|nr:farnesyl pyrophosphate synthetase [Macrophomina phaseolina]